MSATSTVFEPRFADFRQAANVLVDDNHHAVISDFGQSEMRSEVYRISGLGGHGREWRRPPALAIQLIDDRFCRWYTAMASA